MFSSKPSHRYSPLPSSAANSPALGGLPSSPLVGGHPSASPTTSSLLAQYKHLHWSFRLALAVYLLFSLSTFTLKVALPTLFPFGAYELGDALAVDGEDGTTASSRWSLAGWRAAAGGAGAGSEDEDLPPSVLAATNASSGASDASSSAGEWDTVRRITDDPTAQRDPHQNPLSPFSHTYRFSKFHEKVHWDVPDEIEAYVYRASSAPPSTTHSVTAALYSNEIWYSSVLPLFAASWGGPISLVLEVGHSRQNKVLRSSLLAEIEGLRAKDENVRKWVDFHLVGTPKSKSARLAAKTLERLVTTPVAWNFHANLARFFAPTEVVWLVGDGRVLPSPGLRERLEQEDVYLATVKRGDAVVVPVFGFLRNSSSGKGLPTLEEARKKAGLPQAQGKKSKWAGVEQAELAALGAANVQAHWDTLPVLGGMEAWPSEKESLVGLVQPATGAAGTPAKRMVMFDMHWEANHGPTNWPLWKLLPGEQSLQESADAGGGAGLGFSKESKAKSSVVGGGATLFKVTDYDLNYAPHLVIAKRAQPWCTERFESLRSACVYQTYLAGAQMWVLPDRWSVTLEGVEEATGGRGREVDPGDKLKNSITSRLYGKFHQEACMHYAREFLSLRMWDSDLAQHVRFTCARVLATWGMGQ